VSAIQDGWTHTKGGGLAAVTGIALPTLNGVSVERVDADVEDTADLLDQVAATRLPSTQEPATVSWICVQVRPASVVLNKPTEIFTLIVATVAVLRDKFKRDLRLRTKQDHRAGEMSDRT
jgi:hypothetical protein